MADNTTTYKAVIDAEVKGADEIKDLGDKTEETGDKFVKLQRTVVFGRGRGGGWRWCGGDR